MADRNVIIRLRGDISDFQGKMLAASRSIGGVADKMTGAEKESVKFRQGLDKLGSAGGKVGLAAAAGIAVAVKAFADFDQAMSGVQAATHETAENMDELRKLALQTGADTAFSAREAADGIEQLAKAGVATSDIMGGALQGALDLAAAGTVDVGFAAETAATAMTQFNIAGEQVPHIADLLAAAAGKAQGEVSDMAAALKQSGLVASQTGLSLEETTGTLAAFASAGLIGSDAGTSFKTMLQSLTPSSEQAAKAMESLGISAYDANGNFIGIAEFAGVLRKALKDLTVEQQNATLKTIFGSDAVRAASVIYQQGARGIQDWIDKANDQGYAADTAAIKMDNLAGDLEKLKGALSTLLIEGGENGDGFLRGAVQSTEDFVNALSKLPSGVDKALFALTALTALTGGSLWFGAKVLGAVASMRTALVQLGITADGATVSMSRLAASAGLLAGLTFVGLGTLDLQDTARRSSEAADAIGNSFEDLQTILNDSNLGKYATDLGIDLNRLAADLADNGEKGEYATEVMEKLKGSAKGFKALFFGEIGAVIPGFTNDTEKAASAWSDLYDILGNNDALIGAGQAARDLNVAQRTTGRTLDELASPADRAARGIEGVGRAADRASLQAEALDAAMGELEATLSGRQKNRAYEQSLDDLANRLKERADLQKELQQAQGDLAGADTKEERQSALDHIKDLKEQIADYRLTLDEGTQAGRDWNASLEDIAKNAVETGGTLEGMDRVRFLNNARKDFIDLATKITGSRKKAEELADELELVHHKKVKPEVDVDTDRARNQVDKLLKWIEEQRIHLWLDPVMKKNDIGEFGDPRFNRGFADGGWTGDYPINRVAGVVHGQEYVVPAGPASEYRAFLDAISGKVRGYRDGGFVRQVQNQTVNHYGGGVSIDYDRLTASILRARPMYGPAHFHSEGDYERAKRDHNRAVSGGGVPF